MRDAAEDIAVRAVQAYINVLRDRDISVVWSPRSNIALYGHTANVTLLDRLGVNIALSSDWLPSGSMNMLRD